jgi:ubiquinone/menaquinone biosynthesis C-methylase UbiE
MNVACPACHGQLVVEQDEAHCAACERVYPRVNGFLGLVPALTSQHGQQRAYFDAEFAQYRTYEIENWRQSFLDRIFAALELEPEQDRYLDIGVGGSGATVIEAARRGVESWGCDLSPAGIAQAARFAAEQGVAERSEFVLCSAEALPFPEESFSGVSAVALLEHLDDDDVAIAEIARVTKPGGRVWVMVPHAFRYMPPPVWPLYWWHDRRIGHKRHYTSEQLIDRFSAAGFTHLRTEYSAHPVKLVQYAVDKLVPSRVEAKLSWWWRLEALDRRASRRRWGALHLAALFTKA